MKTIKINDIDCTITLPDGLEVDIENSDLSKGIIATKKIERKLPKKFEEISSITHFFKMNCPVGYLPVFEALSKLITLRDAYNGEPLGNWQKWDGETEAYTINFLNNKEKIFVNYSISSPMAFKTEELAKEFLKNFEDLLMIAKPLL